MCPDKRLFIFLFGGVFLCLMLSSCSVLRRDDCPRRYAGDRATSAFQNNVLTYPEIHVIPEMAGDATFLVNQEIAFRHAKHTK